MPRVYVDERRPPPEVHSNDTIASAHHVMFRLYAPSRDLPNGRNDAAELAEEEEEEEDEEEEEEDEEGVDGVALQSPSSVRLHRSGTRRRRKIGKGIQLILLRSYVHCAKQLGRLPDRVTTEQLLEQGYDEFYYQGGNLNEPRLDYAAFLKLVRNRRSEVMRQTRSGRSMMSQRSSARHCHKEQMEIRALINELEQVRHGQRPRGGAVGYDTLGIRSGSQKPRAVGTDTAVPILSDSSSIMGDAGTDGGVSAGDLSTAETYSSVMSGTDGSNDDVVISRSKLNVMLRAAQETLVAQKRILDAVRAMEQRCRHSVAWKQ
ncbi:unnamed protein product [Hyaloperonospora brassicae]|uniref:Uncharacterized protein n=1 Tax=Hyaloperonospora brassicae TaxID=162125 RepID=A0AAV0TFM9_HYABA|nr:unnamed protein product [Hyaloperonospora brassicae]